MFCENSNALATENQREQICSLRFFCMASDFSCKQFYTVIYCLRTRKEDNEDHHKCIIDGAVLRAD